LSNQNFHHIFNGYCKNRIGDHFIERGDYQVIRAEDSQTIVPAEFSSKVESGMVLEISIVLQQRAAFPGGGKKCPRCSYKNSNVARSGGWIEWKVSAAFYRLSINTTFCSYKCVGQFRIVEIGENDGQIISLASYVNCSSSLRGDQ
jgi:hypothetical protein